MPPIDSGQPSWHTRLSAFAGRLDWLRGTRAAVALCVPLVLGDLWHIPNLGWAGLGGFEAILADPGGPYRARLHGLITLALGGGLGVFLGSLVGAHLLWAVPVTLLWCFLWSYLAVLGPPFTTASVLVEVVYICGIGAPTSDAHAALNLGLLLLAGGLWAAALSLFLWPLDPYRPARSAIGQCYIELASFLASAVELSKRPASATSLWHRLAQHHQYRVRHAVERAWEAIAQARSEQFTSSAQMNHLIVLLETADLLIARTIAIAEHLEHQHGAQNGQFCSDSAFAGLDNLRSTEALISVLLTRRSALPISQIRAQRDAVSFLPISVSPCAGASDPSNRFLFEQIAQSASLLETALDTSAQLRSGPSKTPTHPRLASVTHFGYVYGRLAQLRRGWSLDSLRAHLTLKSLTLRHALRVAIVCSLDVALVLRFEVNHGYWLLLTSLIVLQPHVGSTLRRGVQRIGGTIAGGVLAALLAMLLHSQMATAAVLFPCALLSLAILPVSYAAFAFFLTPTFVLAWMPYAGDWQLAVVRILNTIAGASISTIAMLFLFPAYERERAPQVLRESVAADRAYLQELAGAWRSGSRSSRILANARRRTGLAHNAAEESLDRLLAESWRAREGFGRSATTVVTYLRRFAQGVTTLTALEGEWNWKRSQPVQDRLSILDRRLEWLERVLTSPDAPPVPPWQAPSSADSPPANHPGTIQLERLLQHTDVLRQQLDFLRDSGWTSS